VFALIEAVEVNGIAVTELKSLRSNDSANAVIDLTLSEDEGDSSPAPVLHFRPLEETPAGEPTNTGLPDHGLLLDRDFGSFNHWGSGRAASFFSRKVFKGGSSRTRRRIASRPSTRGNEHNALSCTLQSPDYQMSKRRRVEFDPTTHDQERDRGDDPKQIDRRPQVDIPKKTSEVCPSPASSKSLSAQAIQATQNGRDGHELSKDTLNESLKIALRQQVFPHVNQRLSHYRLSIDSSTRRQLGKKVRPISATF
jgi:hypothetical protein